jgi:hypothetical protein
MKEATYSGMDAKIATLDVGGAKIPVLGFGTYGMAGCRIFSWLRSSGVFVTLIQRRCTRTKPMLALPSARPAFRETRFL